MLKKTIPFFLILSILSCKKSVEPAEDNELITTVEIVVTSPDKSVKTFKYEDLDGAGGNNPIIDKISLKPNLTYAIQANFYDKSKIPIVNLTPEILKEGDEHLVLYTFSPSSLAVFSATDSDANGLKIGLSGNLKTNTIGTGKMKLQLRHQPPINGKKVKDGTISPGTDDINVDFDIVIQ